MSRRYTSEEKQHALQLLAANDGDIHLTCAQTGVPERTLSRWKRGRSLSPPPPQIVSPPPPPPPPQPPSPPPISDDAAEVLRDLQQRLLRETYRLISAIEGTIDDKTSVNQVVSAISQLIDRYMKLSAQLPREQENEPILRIEYVEVDDAPND